MNFQDKTKYAKKENQPDEFSKFWFSNMFLFPYKKKSRLHKFCEFCSTQFIAINVAGRQFLAPLYFLLLLFHRESRCRDEWNFWFFFSHKFPRRHSISSHINIKRCLSCDKRIWNRLKSTLPLFSLSIFAFPTAQHRP